MTDQSKTRRTPGKGEGDSREERLRAALRANLARRKAQARARSDRESGKETQQHGTSNDTGGKDS